MREMQGTSVLRLALLLAVVLGLASCTVAAGPDAEPAGPVEGLLAGAFNQHDHAAILQEQGADALGEAWAMAGEAEIVYLTVDMAQRNSLSNIQRRGPFRAWVAATADAALSDPPGQGGSAGRFLLAFAHPSGAPLPAPLPALLTLEVGDPVAGDGASGVSVFSATLRAPVRED